MSDVNKQLLDALVGMVGMWKTTCYAMNWHPDRLDEYNIARTAIAAAEQAQQDETVAWESIEAIAVDRYKVVPSHESMFYRFAVVSGDGRQQLYLGRKVECTTMARRFSGAFLDGAFAYQQILENQPSRQPPAVPDGYALVPIEPTPNMVSAGAEGDSQFFEHAKFVYCAMLSAAQNPEVEK